jgi:hypothetical protein
MGRLEGSESLIDILQILKAEKWTGEENLNKDVGPHYFVHYMGWRSRCE